MTKKNTAKSLEEPVGKPLPPKRRTRMIALEPRMLFDGALGVDLLNQATAPAEATATEPSPEVQAPAATEAPQTFTAEDALTKPADAPADTAALERPSDPASTPSGKEILFIDGAVEDIEQIQAATRSDVEIIVLDTTRDGIEQISQALGSRSGVEAVHIVSHGRPGEITLGSTKLTLESAAARATEIEAWGEHLSAGSDLLLYGCEVSGGDRGTAYVDLLARLTGADVAASTDNTGSFSQGGNWQLETTVGDVTASPFYGDQSLVTTGEILLPTTNLTSSSPWSTVFAGSNYDVGGDSVGGGSTDIIADATHGSLYTNFDDKGTSGTTDDMLAFRVRLAGDGGATFSQVFFVGIDANMDGAIDAFVGVDNQGGSNFIRIWDAGASANTSPSTTSIATTSYNYSETAANYNYSAVASTNDPNWNGATDLDAGGRADYFLSFQVSFADISAFLATQGITGVTKDTTMQYMYGSSTQSNAINSDIAGVSGNVNSSLTWGQLGAFSEPMSASNAAPIITSFGGQDSGATAIVSGTTSITTMTGSDPNGDSITWSISGGADASKFTIDAATGTLTFVSAPDSAVPTDSDGDNRYVVEITATDSKGAVDRQTVAVDVLSNADTTAPTRTSTFPADNATNVPVNSSLSITFSEPIQAGAGNISIYDGTTLVTRIPITDTRQITISGSTVYVDPGVFLTKNHTYTVLYDTGIVKDLSGNTAAGLTDTTAFNFTTANSATGDVTSPTLTSSSPADNAVGVALNNNISLTFSENVMPDSGYIYIYKSDGTLFERLAVTDGTRVTFSGSTVTLNPANDLSPSTGYYVRVEAAAVQDLAGNRFVGISDSATLNFTTAANQAPVNTPPAVQATNEDTSLVFSTANGNALTVADPDSTSLTVTLSVTNGTLTLGSLSGLTFTAGDGTSDSTMTFTGTKSNINTALNGLAFAPVANYSGAATLTITSVDSYAATDTDTVAITVNPVNDAPVVNDGVASTSEDTAVSGTLSASDIEGSTLTFSQVTGPANGTLTLNAATGAYTYTPNANWSGTDTFTYKVNDGTTDSATATVTITVAPVNDAPTANNVTASTNEDAALSGTLPASDVEGSALTFSQVTGPTNGTLTLNAATGAYTYTPNANFYGTDSFTYKVNDGALDSATATVTITVAPVNDAPVANDATASTSEDTAVSGTLSGSDIEGSGLSFSQVSGPANGTITLNAATGAYTYTPNANWSGTDTFTYKVNDGTADSATATVTITVGAVNDAPVANDATASTNEDTAVSGTLSASDVEGSALTFSQVAGPANGTLTLNAATGAYTYTPSANWSGTDTFTYKVNDGALDSATATVTITVAPVNDAPTANTATATTNEDMAVSGTLSGSDIEGSTLSFSQVAGPANGTLTLNAATGAYTYTPDANWSGTDTFTYKVNDGVLDSATATVTITVGAVNDAPVANDATASTNEDTAVSGTLAASDVEGSALTFSQVAGPANGTLTLNAATGAYTYTPSANWSGTDTFTYKVNDGTTDSATATVTITVAPVNDAPTANDATASTNEDTAVSGTLSASDVEGSTLSFSQVAGPANGTLTLNAATGAYTYSPNANWSGTDTFTYKVNDGTTDSATATVTITVAAVNDAPTVNDATAITNEDTAVSGTLSASDVEGSALSFSQVAGPANGTLTLNAATGAYTYTPNANWSGTDSFTYKVNDGTLDSATATVTITVAPVNDAPVANNATATTNQNAALSGTLSASDVEGSSLTFSPVGGPANGTLSINAATGAYTYTPAVNWSGTDSFTYKVNDGTLDSATATVTITVNSGSAPANTVPGAQVVNEDVASSISGVSVVDVDGNLAMTRISVGNGTLSVDLSAGATLSAGANNSATLTLNGTQAQINAALASLTYQGSANFFGSDTLTVVSTDATGASDTDTVTLTVASVNDAPTANNAVATTNEDQAVSGTLSASDVEGSTLTFSAVAGPANGSLVLNADGTYTYTPNANYFGTDSFTYKVNDGTSDSGVATVTLTVASVNDAPTVSVTPAAVAEGSAVALTSNLSATDVDNTGSQLVYTVTTAPVRGQLLLNGAPLALGSTFTQADVAAGLVTYSHGGSETSSDSVTFSVSDGSATLANKSLSISVTPVNDNDPVFTSLAAYSVGDNATAVGSVAASDADLPAQTLTYSVVGGTDAALFGINASTGALSFLAPADYDAPADTNGDNVYQLQVQVSDGSRTALQNVSVTVNPGNAPVNTLPGAQAVNEDAILVFSGASAPSVSDSDTGTLTVTVSVTNGTVSLASTSGLAFLTGDGNADSTMRFTGAVADINAALDGLVYAPAANYNGPASLTISSSDGTTADTDTVSITVAAVNDAPVAANAAATVAEDGTLNGTLPVATDVELDALTYVKVSDPANGAVTVNADGTYTYTPNANFNGADSFTYKVNDGAADSAIATVMLTVTAVNDAPVASNATVAGAEDSALNGTLPAATDADLDTLSYVKMADPANGTVTLNANGTYTYTPAANFNGTDSFTYKVRDGSADSAVATVTITVAAVNDAPSASNSAATVAEDGVLAGTLPVATDADLDALSYVKVSNPANGTVTVNANGTFTYTPAANFNGTDSFTYKVNDGAADSAVATVTITVTPVNDAPSVSSLALAINEDTALNGTLPAATDADGDALTYSKVAGPANGTLTINADGTYAYRPNANFSGTDSFTYKVNDGAADSAIATVTITVLPVNDAPVAGTIDAQAATDGVPFSFAVPAGTFADADSALAMSATLEDGSPLPAWLAFDPATGQFSGTPPSGFAGLQVRVTASDGAVSASASFAIVARQPAMPSTVIAAADSTAAPRAGEGAAAAPVVLSAPPGSSAFGAMPLQLPVDATVPAANLMGVAGVTGESGGTVAASPDLNLLPATAAGPSDLLGFPVARLSPDQGRASEAAGFTLAGHRLYVFHGIPDMRLGADGLGAMRIPEDAFAHTDPAAVVHLEARLANGLVLPGWLRFDGVRGTFSGLPPEDLAGQMEIEVIARDTEGREARTRFVLLVEDLRTAGMRGAEAVDAMLGLDVDKDEAEKARLEAARQAIPARAGAGKPVPERLKSPAASFSEQMRTAKAPRDPLLDRVTRSDIHKPRSKP